VRLDSDAIVWGDLLLRFALMSISKFSGARFPLSFLFHRQSYPRPFTITRLEHHRRQHGEPGAWLAVLNEEQNVLAGKFWRWLQRVVGKSASR